MLPKWGQGPEGKGQVGKLNAGCRGQREHNHLLKIQHFEFVTTSKSFARSIAGAVNLEEGFRTQVMAPSGEGGWGRRGGGGGRRPQTRWKGVHALTSPDAKARGGVLDGGKGAVLEGILQG